MTITLKNNIKIVGYDAYHDGIYFYNNYQDQITLGEILLFVSKIEKEVLPTTRDDFCFTLEQNVILFYIAEAKTFILNLGIDKYQIKRTCC